MNKKHIIIASIAAVGIFIVGYFVGDTTATNRANSLVDASVAIKMANAETKTEPVTEVKEETKAFEVATGGDSGNWNMKVLDAKEDTIVKGGESSDNKSTKEKFIIVKLQMKNITKSAVQYSPGEFKLGDMKSKSQYDVNLDALQAANSNEKIYKENGEFIGVYDDTNPNMSKQTYIIFEVPKDFNIADGVLMNQNGAQTEPKGFYIK